MEATTEPRQPELLGAEETRTILGVGRSAFYELARKDQLPIPTLRVGHRLKFSRRQLEALLDRQHEPPTSPDQRDGEDA